MKATRVLSVGSVILLFLIGTIHCAGPQVQATKGSRAETVSKEIDTVFHNSFGHFNVTKIHIYLTEIQPYLSCKFPLFIFFMNFKTFLHRY